MWLELGQLERRSAKAEAAGANPVNHISELKRILPSGNGDGGRGERVSRAGRSLTIEQGSDAWVRGETDDQPRLLSGELQVRILPGP